jgi:hypothetical protein
MFVLPEEQKIILPPANDHGPSLSAGQHFSTSAGQRVPACNAPTGKRAPWQTMLGFSTAQSEQRGLPRKPEC